MLGQTRCPMKKTYEPTPRVPEELFARYRAILAVLSGQTTVSEAARSLDLSRNHFQSLMHRGLSGLIEGMGKKPPGRPGRSAPEKALTQETERLLKENERLKHRVETTDRLLLVASDLLKGRINVRGRSRKSRRKAAEKAGEDTDEGERVCLREVSEMRRLGLPATLSAAVAGVAEATLRRWSLRQRHGRLLCNRRGPQPRGPLSPEKQTLLEQRLRELRGLAGASSLARMVGVSRRQALAVKKKTLTAMERERRRQCWRVRVERVGVIRGFDQLCVATRAGMRYALVSADGKLPYRTSITVTDCYDGCNITRALEKDFASAGVPLVWRADRWRAHETKQVRELLDRHGVLLLHGPAYYPRFYGQLERQNREHRAWLNTLGSIEPGQLDSEAEKMIAALNTRWPRRRLGWLTPNEAWKMETPPNIDRQSLRDEVADRAARLACHLPAQRYPKDLATRLAIEQALTNRGLLNFQKGGWC